VLGSRFLRTKAISNRKDEGTSQLFTLSALDRDEVVAVCTSRGHLSVLFGAERLNEACASYLLAGHFDSVGSMINEEELDEIFGVPGRMAALKSLCCDHRLPHIVGFTHDALDFVQISFS
jgi:hypothetical protein